MVFIILMLSFFPVMWLSFFRHENVPGFIWCAIFLAYGIYHDKIRKPERVPSAKTNVNDVRATIIDALEKISSNYDLPDGVRGRNVYIFQNFVIRNYDKIVAENKYNRYFDHNKLDQEIVEYIRAMFDVEQCKFLWNEAKDPEKLKRYGSEVDELCAKKISIEDYFAVTSGGVEKSDLDNLRRRKGNSFSKRGKIAQMGQYFLWIDELPRNRENGEGDYE